MGADEGVDLKQKQGLVTCQYFLFRLIANLLTTDRM